MRSILLKILTYFIDKLSDDDYVTPPRFNVELSAWDSNKGKYDIVVSLSDEAIENYMLTENAREKEWHVKADCKLKIKII